MEITGLQPTLTEDFFHGNILKYCARTSFMTEEEKAILSGANKTDKFGNGYDREDVKHLRISEKSIELMNRSLIENINAVVKENDTLWHLGDFGFFKSFNQAKYIRDQINCQNINLVWGNHDDDFIRPLFSKVYGKTGDYSLVNINISGQKIVLSHFPMLSWDQSHRGMTACLSGHTHNSLISSSYKGFCNGLNFDVGVDSAACYFTDKSSFSPMKVYRPFSFVEIIKIIQEKDKMIKNLS